MTTASYVPPTVHINESILISHNAGYYILVLLLAIVLWSISNKSRINDDIPGPWLARWTPLWLAYHARFGQRYKEVHKLHMRYGPFVRISPNHVSISDKEAIPVVYGQGSGAFPKSPFYDAFVSERPSVFSTTDREEHSQKRRLVSHALSNQSLQQFTPFIEKIIGKFVQQMDKMGQTGEYVNILDWFNYLTFDILSDLAFGEPIGMVENGSDVVRVQKVSGEIAEEHAISLVDEREHLAAIVGLHPSFKLISKLLPDPFFVRAHKAFSGLGDLARRRVTQRLQSKCDREDILGKLINAHTDGKRDVTQEEITSLTAETVTLLIAGSDTTSNSMTAILFYVLRHPAVLSKLQDHLCQAIHSEIPTYEEVKNIPYLDAVIDEGLRYHATTAIGLHRTVPEGGVICCGKFFPEGTELSVPAWTIQHDSSIWADPDVFRPERWLEPSKVNLKSYLLTFGKGPRACSSVYGDAYYSGDGLYSLQSSVEVKHPGNRGRIYAQAHSPLCEVEKNEC